VTGLTVSPQNREVWYSSSEPPAVQLQVTATLAAAGLSQSLDVTAERFGTAYASSDDTVAVHEGDGLFRARAAGTTILTAGLGEIHSGQCEFIVKPEIITDPVRLMPLSPEQKLYAGADYGELWLEVTNIVPSKVTSLNIDGAPVPLYRVPASMPHPDPVYGEVIGGKDKLSSDSAAPEVVVGSVTESDEGSVYYHRFTVDSPANYVIEITSASFGDEDNDTEIFLFEDDGELDEDDYIDDDDDGGVDYLSKIQRRLEPGDYIVAVGVYALNLAEALAGFNDEDYGGDFTLSIESDGAEILADKPAILRITYADGVPANALGQVTVGLEVWGHSLEQLHVVEVPVETDPIPTVEIDPGQPSTIDLKVGQALDIPISVSDAGRNYIGLQYVLDGTPLEVQGGGSSGPEGYLIVLDAYEGPVSDGIYRRQGSFNGHPAYVNENGYWIFWDHGPDGGGGHQEWDLSDQLGGDELDYSDVLTENWEMGMVVLPSTFLASTYDEEYGGYGGYDGDDGYDGVSADVNGTYQHTETYNGYPAYTNENGYWIYRGSRWLLSETLGGSQIDDGPTYDLTDEYRWDYFIITLHGLVVSSAEDPTEVNGIYSYDRMFNRQPAYVNDDGYWIFWDNGDYGTGVHEGGDAGGGWDILDVLPVGVIDYEGVYGHEEWFFNTSLENLTSSWHDRDGTGDINVNEVLPGIDESLDPSHMVVWQARTAVDLARRYQETRRAYVVTEDDIGTHELKVRVQERTVDGVNEYDYPEGATYTLNVTAASQDPEVSCDPVAPIVEAVFPAAGQTVYVRGSGDDIGGETSNFRPVTIRADAASGIAAVEWVYVPAGSGEAVAHVLESRDSVYFSLESPEAYSAMLQAGLTQLEFRVTTNCGHISTHTIAVTLQADPWALISLVNPTTGLQWTQGESHMLEIALEDPGRDVLSIAGYLFPRGWQPPVEDHLNQNVDTAVSSITTSGIVLAHHLLADLKYAPDEDPEDWRLWINETDNFVFRLPVPDTLSIPAGSYDLRLLTIETDGKIALSDPVSTNVVENRTPPVLTASTVAYRVPAGESVPVWFEAHKLGTLARVTLSVDGILADEIDADGQRSLSGQFMVPVADTAQDGDIVHILVTAEDTLGITSTFEIPYEVGAWGADTVVVNGPATADDGMRYTNVVVKIGGSLYYNDAAISLNALVVESGGEVVIGPSVVELQLHAQLQADAGGILRAETVSSYNQDGRYAYGGAHGGNASANLDAWAYPAYGDFRKPQFPGGSSGPYAAATGGGVLKISAPAIIVNGVIAADGQSLTAAQTSPYGSGAGGSVLIETGTISGSGTIRANGGDVANSNQGAGAGGRIAIYYDLYGDGSIPIADGLALEAQAGSAPVIDNCGGAGTIFLKKSDQQNGELHLDAAGLGHPKAKSTLRSIGRHPIIEILPVEGESDLYRVYIEYYPSRWVADFNPGNWTLGLRGLFVSLNADDLQAPLYEVIDNGGNYLVVRSDTAPVAEAGSELIGVIRLDKLVASAGVRLVASDRIHADRFEVVDSAVLEEVPVLCTDEVTSLGAVSVTGDDVYYVQNIQLVSLTLTGGSFTTRGQATVSGNVVVGGQGARLAARELIISGSMTVDGAVLETAVTHGIEVRGSVHLRNNAKLTVPEADDDRYHRLDMAVDQTLTVCCWNRHF